MMDGRFIDISESLKKGWLGIATAVGEQVPT